MIEFRYFHATPAPSPRDCHRCGTEQNEEHGSVFPWVAVDVDSPSGTGESGLTTFEQEHGCQCNR